MGVWFVFRRMLLLVAAGLFLCTTFSCSDARASVSVHGLSKPFGTRKSVRSWTPGSFTSESFTTSGSFKRESWAADPFIRERWTADERDEGFFEKWPYCYEKKCRCYKDKADCSYSGLTFIPHFNQSVRYLNFTNNNLHDISDDSFFDNVTQLEGIDLANNELSSISSTVAFQRFTNLTHLILAYNFLKYEALEPVLSIRTLQYLNLIKCHLGTLPNDLFFKHRMPILRTLYLHHNALKHVNSTAFSFLPALERLGLAENRIQWIHAHKLPTLQKLNLNSNDLQFFPRSCNFSSSLFPNLGFMDLRNNRINKFSKRVCLPKLQWLDLTGNIFPVLQTDMLKGFPALYHLSLEAMGTEIKTIEPYAFRHPTLQAVSLMYNNLAFSKRSIHQGSFEGCPNLTYLQLSHNEIRHSTFRKLFGNLTSLRYLFIGHCGLKEIFVHTFSRLTRLVNISLYRNELTSLPDGAFDKLTKLKVLDLSNNLIRTVREKTFSEKTRKRLLHLDLSNNKFDCSCDLQWFRNWLILHPSLFHNSWSSYRCANVFNTTLESFHVVEQTCLLDSDENMFISVTVGLLILILTVTALTYRYRWHLRLVLYEAFRGRGDRWRRLQALSFQFDVFVSYAADDLNWVRTQLMPELEERMGLKLCIHERDFIPGYPIVDNISDSVEASKKVMMIFSKHFTRSQWCQFELCFCLNHVIKNDDALLVVCLEDLSSRDLTPAMMAVLGTTTYIQWNDESDARRSFWGRLQIALHEVMRSPRI